MQCFINVDGKEKMNIECELIRIPELFKLKMSIKSRKHKRCSTRNDIINIKDPYNERMPF